VFAGLPGTGIGGLFYLLLAAFMPLKHAWRALRRRTADGHGRLVLRSLAFAGAILAVLWAQAWALKEVILAAASPAEVALVTGESTSAYMRTAASASLASLVAVVLVVHALRLFVKRPSAASHAALGRPSRTDDTP
jgi:hypothetical protein